MANQIVWFDVPVIDLDRAVRFYTTVLDTPVEKQEYPGMKFAILSHEEDDVSGCLTPGCAEDPVKPSQDGPLLYFNCEGRLEKAIAAASVEISGHREAIAKELGEKYAAIFEAHLQMLQDSRLRG